MHKEHLVVVVSIPAYITLVVISAIVGAGFLSTIYRYRQSRSLVEIGRILSGILLLPGIAIAMCTKWESNIGFWLILGGFIISMLSDLVVRRLEARYLRNRKDYK